MTGSPTASEVHVVSHTHWDREWYRSFATFRAMLVEVADAVVAQLEAGTLAHFLLDGQTIAAADVLAVRPDLEARMAALVRAGRLHLGPWHVLADMTLVSGEALVRNLLRGRHWGDRLGGLLPVGYCPDMFGHPPDLPRILRGFGIATAVVWRGAPPSPGRFRWRSPDGSEVLAVRSRYYNPEVLWAAPGATQRMAAWLTEQRSADPDGPWLLLNGGDHLAPRDLDGRLDGLAPVPVCEVSLAEHLDAVARAHTPAALPVVEGELRRSGREGAFLLPGTLSTRMELKQANAAAQALLERWVEPWAVWADLTAPEVAGPAAEGVAGPATVRALLDRAWDDLLANQAHDSICGCGIDSIHRQGLVRFAAVNDLGEHLLERCLRRTGLHTRLPGRPPAEELTLAVANPHGSPLTGGVTVTLAVAPGRAPVALLDDQGREVPFAAVAQGRRTGFDSDVATLPYWPEHDAHLLRFVAHDVAPCGWATYRVRLGERTPAAALETHDDGAQVEVDGWHLAADDDGTVTLTHLATQRRHPGLGRLEDGGDAGDTYTHEPPQDDRLVRGRLQGVRRVRSAVDAELRLTVVLDLPAGLAPDRARRAEATVPTAFAVAVRRWRGVEQLEWTVRSDVTVTDHRLRAIVPVGTAAATWDTDAAWCTVTRPVLDGPPVPAQGPGEESPVATAPLQTWCAAGEGPARVAVLASGLPEAEARPGPGGTELAVTLLRGVGWLGRHDLRHRTMGAGPPVEVPDAQGTGAHTWRWAVRVGDTDDALALAAQAWRAPLRAFALAAPAAPQRSHLRLDGGALLSAVKPAEDGDGAVVRVHNPTPRTLRARLALLVAEVVEEVDLSESTGGAVERAGPGTVVELGPWAVRSLRIRLPRG